MVVSCTGKTPVVPRAKVRKPEPEVYAAAAAQNLSGVRSRLGRWIGLIEGTSRSVPGHSRPSHHKPKSSNVRCCPRLCENVHEPRVCKIIFSIVFFR
jgi:hypothetical protein